MKLYTKAEPSDMFSGYGSTDIHEYQISIEIFAWEYYDDECDIDHPNWKQFNEEWEIVAEVFGGIRGVIGEVWIEYDDQEVKENLLIQAAISKATKFIQENLDHYIKLESLSSPQVQEEA
ncbi:hypothetical protein [Paenibacillus glycanilyticus]|uniref:hypothetical protein n=1 Tax=Paenibacillus glycanilyticus TaxID=126569 RepID=UPI003EBA504B